MADRRSGAFVPLVIFLFLVFQPGPPPVRNAQFEAQDAQLRIEQVIAEEQRLLSLVGNSTWDADFGSEGHTLNLTGLEPERDFAWDALTSVRGRAREHLQYSLGGWGEAALDGATDQPNPTALYRNATGYVSGKWRRSRLQENIPIPQLNLTEYAPARPFGHARHPRPFDRNITGADGEVTIRFNEKDFPHGVSANPASQNITEMGVELKITDSESQDGWETQLRGFYFTDLGQAILTTTSAKFGGIFLLPHLALSPRTFESARELLNQSISNTIQRQIDGKTESLNPWHSRVEGSQDDPFRSLDCEMVVYLQQLTPAEGAVHSPALMGFLEHELRFPTGAFVPNAPDLRFSMLVFSPDCGYVLESKGPPDDFANDGDHLTGPKMEVQFIHSRQHLLIFSLALALQLFLLMRQMREASTPSTRSRISFYTVAILALGDGFTTMSFMFVSLFVSGLWVNLVSTGFLAFLNVSFFGMRFLFDIWQVQAPERERAVRAEVEEDQRRLQRFQEAMQRIRAERLERERQHQTSSQTNPTAVNEPPATDDTPPPPPGDRPTATTDTETLPAPVTAARPVDTGATPVFMPSDQEGLESIGPPVPMTTEAQVQARMPSFASVYIKFYMFLLAALFLSAFASSWPAAARHVFFIMLGMLYLSPWIPQILRNVQRNCRHALNWEFVLGQSVLRLAPAFYFFAYKHNVLFAEQDYYGLAAIVIWVWTQVLILASQEFVGPRWLVRSTWAPPAYDYHPILREDEEGATMPIGFSQAAADASTPSSPVLGRADSAPLIRRVSIAKETKEKGKRVFDCAICMQDLEVPVIEAGGSGDAGLGVNLLARRAYMVTPCRHIFHSTCLEGWMKYRLQCPICRETLPPL